MNRKLKKSFKKYDKSKTNKETLISGELGITLSGTKIVEVPSRKGFVYVRLKGNTSELIQAFNATVSPVYGLPVFVVRQGGIYKVAGRNIDRYPNQFTTAAPLLPKHGIQHSFNHEIGAGGDVVWVYSQQFMPLLSYPSGTAGGMSISLSPAFYEWQGQWKYAQVTGTPSYAPYVPTSAGARMVLSYIDPSDNSIKLVPGTPFDGSVTGAAQIAQYIPDIPRSLGIPLAAVRLVTGTTVINWDAIYDLRDFYTVGNSITGTVASVDTIGFAGMDDGIPVGTGTVLNVTGDLNLTRSGTVFNLNYVAGGPGGGGGAGVMGWDEGVPLGTGTVFNFIGNGVTSSISGSVIQVDIPGKYLIQELNPVGIGTASFTNIPSTYKRLSVDFAIRTTQATTATTLAIYLNGDTGVANYRGTSTFGYLTSSVGALGADGINVGATSVPGANSPTGSFLVAEASFIQYSNIHFNKQMYVQGGARQDVSSVHELIFNFAGEWENTAIINRVDFALGAGNYVTGSVLRMYGEH